MIPESVALLCFVGTYVHVLVRCQYMYLFSISSVRHIAINLDQMLFDFNGCLSNDMLMLLQLLFLSEEKRGMKYSLQKKYWWVLIWFFYIRFSAKKYKRSLLGNNPIISKVMYYNKIFFIFDIY